MSNMVTMSEWISIKDRLPKIGKRVLATNGSFVGEAFLGAREKWFRYHYLMLENELFRITHWMPMPVGPESEEKQHD